MTEQRTSAEPGSDADEIVREKERRRTSDEPEPKDANPLLREGPDAPDAADIEDPDEQL